MFKKILLLGMMFPLVCHSVLNAEDFSLTNIQILYGNQFNDWYYGYATPSEKMTTVTIEHFGIWAWGDNFFFVDVLHGDFGGANNDLKDKLYGEWLTRFSLSQMTRRHFGAGFIRDIYLAAQFDRGGDGYWANMVGLGFDLTVPGFQNVVFNTLYRRDKFNNPGFLMTAVWGTSKSLGMLNLCFEGYLDVSNTDNDGLDINAQPQWLLGFKGTENSLLRAWRTGIEWYYHKNKALTVNAPQLVIKWIW